MRLLFVSNLYPPAGSGGYELQCEEVARAMTTRGHEVIVLTSKLVGHPAVARLSEVSVHRTLELEVTGGVASTMMRVARRRAIARQNDEAVVEVVEASGPDLVVMWAMWNVPRAVPALVERLMPERVVYYICDYWPTLPRAWVQQLRARHGGGSPLCRSDCSPRWRCRALPAIASRRFVWRVPSA